MSAVFGQIQRTVNLSEEVAASIKEAIITGQYGPGDPLPSENELAAQFGVSRPVIREALKPLQSAGFLEIRRGTKGGAFVSDLARLNLSENLTDLIRLRRITVDHMFQARLHIEPEIMRLAVKNITRRQIEKLCRIVEETNSVEDDIQRIELNSEFHRVIGRACGNPFYSLLMESFMDFAGSFVLTIKPVSRSLHHQEDHAAILQAINEGDAEKAVRLSLEHLSDMHDKMKKLETSYLALASGKKSPPTPNETAP